MMALVATRQDEGWRRRGSMIPAWPWSRMTARRRCCCPCRHSCRRRRGATGDRAEAASEQLKQFVAQAPQSNDAAVLCGQVLGLAGELNAQAAGVRKDSPSIRAFAAALDVSAGRCAVPQGSWRAGT